MSDTGRLFDPGPDDQARRWSSWRCVTCSLVLDRSQVTAHVLMRGHSCVPVVGAIRRRVAP